MKINEEESEWNDFDELVKWNKYNKITHINYSYNQNKLTKLPNALICLECYSNKLIELPNSLLNCRDLISINYERNEIELSIQQLIFINRINNIQLTNNNIYSDNQNVHNSSIQQCLLNSINNLLTN